MKYPAEAFIIECNRLTLQYKRAPLSQEEFLRLVRGHEKLLVAIGKL